MNTITVKQFVSIFKDVYSLSQDQRFCFIIGAGASVSSGIKSGATMAEIWFKEIEDRENKDYLDKWKKENKIDTNKIACYYGEIYRERFKLNKASGYDYLYNEMKQSNPSFGYSVLAKILSDSPHNIVITTNFDNLIEESLYTFTSKKFLVCGHESLAGFAKPSRERPLVSKIHRDLMLNPKNDKDEIKDLDDGWKESLDRILNEFTPIVIGYGGNDGSLMSYLLNLKVKNGIYWCLYKDEKPRNDVQKIVKDHNGYFVITDGFDDLMFDINHALNFSPLIEEIDKSSTQKIEKYQNELQKIAENKSNSSIKAERQAAKEFIAKVKLDNAYRYLQMARVEDRIKNQFEILKEGYEFYPENINLLLNLISTAVEMNSPQAESFCEQGLLKLPNNPLINNNLGLLKLHNKEFEQAFKLLRSAYVTDSKDIITINNLGTYMTLTGDYAKARYYLFKAYDLDNSNCITNSNLAGVCFMEGKIKEGREFALSACTSTPKSKWALRGWFYLYSFDPHKYLTLAEERVKKLLEFGDVVKSTLYDLTPYVNKALALNHPNPAMVKEFASRINSLDE